MPLCALLTFYFLCRGLRSNRRLHFGLAGLLLGITMYTYQASRFVPFLVLLLVGYESLTNKRFIRTYGRSVVLLFAIAFLIFAPLGYYYLTHPEIFLWRASDVSIFSPRQDESPLEALFLSTARTAGMFNFRGDPNWRHNLAGRPAFDPLSSICFLAGLAISIARFNRSRYVFLLLCLAVMSLPVMLSTPREVPQFSRGIGALTVACIFPAIGIKEAWQRVTSRTSPGFRPIFWASVCLLLICATIFTYHDYFISWAGYEHLRDQWFYGGFTDLATTMNELDDPDGVWMLPIYSASSLYGEPGHYVVDFLYRSTAPYHFVALDEETVAQELTRISRGRDRALVVQYKDYTLEKAYEYIDADPKGLLPFLLGKYGQLLARSEFDSFDVLVYDLPEIPRFAIAESFEPLFVNFGNQIALTGVAYGGSSEQGVSTSTEVEQAILPSGRNAWVVLQWEALAAPSRTYKVAVYLLDSQGRSVGQVDKALLSNDGYLTSEWRPGQKEVDYYTLPSLPATPPGGYNIRVVVYDAETMERLTVFDEREGVTKSSLVVGTLQVVKPLVPPRVEPMERLALAERNIAPGIRLLGYDLPVAVVGPGETVSMALYWQALQDVGRNYLLSLGLKDSEGEVRIEQRGRPVDDTYPTTEWDEGEVLRDWHDLALPADMPEGVYEILIGVL